jgi:phosphoglycerate dehydrogenase-like enzyme
MKNILIEMPPHQPSLQKLQALSDVTIEMAEPQEPAPEYSAEQLRDKHIFFGTTPPQGMESLDLVQISSVGYSQLYGLGLAERGVRACNARGVFDPTIAEWNIAMMINLLRDVRGMVRNQEHGVWDRQPRFQRELRGLTVGIWGYGGIGRATAQLAKAFGMRVVVMSRSGVGPREDTYAVEGIGDREGKLPDQVFTSGQETEFLAGLDFLVLAMPQTPSTTGSIGERELDALPPHAFVLNPARGPIIQEEALLKALRTGTIAGAALDTHYYYPMPADHPLWRFPNVIMTPHISGSDSSPHYNDRVWDVFVQNVQRLLAGQPLLNELTEEQLMGE